LYLLQNSWEEANLERGPLGLDIDPVVSSWKWWTGTPDGHPSAWILATLHPPCKVN
jgi:hypothetical protein